eukprot:TRINITY_DN9054_c0_g1_i1.p1 TRINITY_DN9054_c0_g1~~TRINITY_DN9054_c0_g1_i1.p1  ORF type:complete len:121 (-),score=12.10 TRINITY_DN9054_c0_g1_i1:313-675(-)
MFGFNLQVDAVKDLSSILQSCNSLQLTEFLSSPGSQSPNRLEDGEYLEESLSSTTSSGGGCCLSHHKATQNPNSAAATAIFPLPEKMRTGYRCSNGVLLCSHRSVIPSRRKGHPQRSPLN